MGRMLGCWASGGTSRETCLEFESALKTCMDGRVGYSSLCSGGGGAGEWRRGEGGEEEVK